MSTLTRCKRCKGVKLCMGMGGLQSSCKTCKGTGFQSTPSDADEKALLESDKDHALITAQQDPPKKRRPRLPQPISTLDPAVLQA